jgi:ribonuclease G
VKPSITELAQIGQTVMVQVSKQAEGTKGARVTTHFSIPGRWVVYMPDADYIAISRKIEDEPERLRLKQVMESLRRPGEGLIVRTGAHGQTEEALWQDLQDLREQWQSVIHKSKSHEAPLQIYQDLDLLPRLARDVITGDVLEIWVDDQRIYEQLKSLLQNRSPQWQGKISRHDRKIPLFDHFRISEELNRSFRRKIWLPSGGYLIVDQTEALTVIDVNTGKYTGEINLEQTVYEINREAAVEIPRLLRLRNIRGIIIVDFIDMELETNRKVIMDLITKEARKDRSKTVVVGWTKLGLLEMTRKRK